MRKLFLALVILAISITAFGQGNDFGRISGTVTDGAGKAIPEATLTVINTENGVSQSTTSEKTGFYAFPSLKAGNYTIQVQKTGFGTYKLRAVPVDPSSGKTINIPLKPGTEVHEATYVAAVGETGVIDAKKVETGGMNGRNYQQLLREMPGTIAGTLDPFALGLSANGHAMNGVRGGAILMSVDGISMLDPTQNTNVVAIPSPDSIGEVRVLATNFSAENPSLSGAYVDVLSKSGTQKFHGSASEFLRNDMLDAKSDFAIQKEPLHFYIPGKFNASKSKLFFFLTENWKYIHTGVTTLSNVPTAAQLNGVFTTPVYQPGTKTPYTTCPQSPSSVGYCIPNTVWSPSATAELSLYKPANIAVGGNNFSYTGVNRLDNREDRYNIDWVISAKTLLSGRYTHNLNNQYTASTGLNPDLLAPRPSWIWTTSLNHSFTPRLINSFSIAQSIIRFKQIPEVGAAPPTRFERSTVGMTNAELFPGNLFNAVPILTIQGFAGIGQVEYDQKHTTTSQVADEFSWVKGKHILKFGVTYQRSKNDQQYLTNAPTMGIAVYNTSNPNTTGVALADAFAGQLYQYTESSTEGQFTAQYYQLETFAQDVWKARSNLTVSYGVRYNIPQNAWNPYQNESVFLPSLFSAANAPTIDTSTTSTAGSFVPGTGTLYNGLSFLGNSWPSISKWVPGYGTLNTMFHGLSKTFSPTPYNNIAPRVGVNWDAFGNGSTLVRAGIGFFYMRPTQYLVQMPTLNQPFNTLETVLYGQLDHLNGSLNYPTNVYTIPQTMKSDYTEQWNLGVAQKLPWHFSLDAAYVGNEGKHLPEAINESQFPVGTLKAAANAKVAKYAPNALRPYVGYGEIDEVVYEGYSNYHAFQSVLRRRSQKGVSLSSAFTWSKMMENTSQSGLPGTGVPQNSYDPNADYSLADLHRKFVSANNLTYSIPTFRTSKSRLLKNALGFWDVSTNVSYQSGAPLTLCLSGDNAGIGTSVLTGGGNACERVNVSGNPNSMSSRTVSHWFNTAVASTPTAGTLGNAKRNSLTGPYYVQEDASLFKHFNLGAGRDMEFRAEGYNIWNHCSYTSTGTTLGTATFGSVTASTPGRVLQLGAKLKF
jgi:hypothetical protein